MLARLDYTRPRRTFGTRAWPQLRRLCCLFITQRRLGERCTASGSGASSLRKLALSLQHAQPTPKCTVWSACRMLRRSSMPLLREQVTPGCCQRSWRCLSCSSLLCCCGSASTDCHRCDRDEAAASRRSSWAMARTNSLRLLRRPRQPWQGARSRSSALFSRVLKRSSSQNAKPDRESGDARSTRRDILRPPLRLRPTQQRAWHQSAPPRSC